MVGAVRDDGLCRDTGIQNRGQVTGFAALNCRSIYNKILMVWNFVDTYNPDITIGMESWLREEIGNAEIFRADFTIFIFYPLCLRFTSCLPDVVPRALSFPSVCIFTLKSSKEKGKEERRFSPAT